MSRGPENTFIGSVHRHLPESVYSMKNHNQYNGGIADVWYSGAFADLWVEYKFIAVPARADTLIDLTGGKTPALSPLQQQWLNERHAEGRNVAVIVGCKDGGVYMPGISWATARTAAAFKSKIQKRSALAALIENFTNG